MKKVKKIQSLLRFAQEPDESLLGEFLEEKNPKKVKIVRNPSEPSYPYREYPFGERTIELPSGEIEGEPDKRIPPTYAQHLDELIKLIDQQLDELEKLSDKYKKLEQKWRQTKTVQKVIESQKQTLHALFSELKELASYLDRYKAQLLKRKDLVRRIEHLTRLAIRQVPTGRPTKKGVYALLEEIEKDFGITINEEQKEKYLLLTYGRQLQIVIEETERALEELEQEALEEGQQQEVTGALRALRAFKLQKVRDFLEMVVEKVKQVVDKAKEVLTNLLQKSEDVTSKLEDIVDRLESITQT